MPAFISNPVTPLTSDGIRPSHESTNVPTNEPANEPANEPTTPVEITGLPADKSMSHRALLLGLLAAGKTTVTGLLDAEDVHATTTAIQQLGATVIRHQASAPVPPPTNDNGENETIDIIGTAGALTDPATPIDCGNSGTLARLLFGVLCSNDVTATMVGDHSLSTRPMERVVRPLRPIGAHVLYRDCTKGAPSRLPITVSGRHPHAPLDVETTISSAQVKSAVLLAALNAPGENAVAMPVGARDHTERMLASFGVTVQAIRTESSERITMVGQQPLHAPATPLHIPRDISAAAFPLAVIAGLRVASDQRAAGQHGAESGVAEKGAANHPHYVLRRVGNNPTRDGVLKALRMMGVAWGEFPRNAREPRDAHDGDAEAGVPPPSNSQVGDAPAPMQVIDAFPPEQTSDLVVTPPATLHAIDFPPALVPQTIDEFPVLFVLSALAHGTSVFRGIGELRVKESDRIAVMVAGMRQIGIEVDAGDDWVRVRGTGTIPGGNHSPVQVGLDHRIAMAFAVAGMLAQAPVLVSDDAPVATSFPTFFSVMEQLGGKFERGDTPGTQGIDCAMQEHKEQ